MFSESKMTQSIISHIDHLYKFPHTFFLHKSYIYVRCYCPFVI